jgi:hypothetical protein
VFETGASAYVTSPLEHVVLFEPGEGLRLAAALTPLAAQAQ